MMENKEFICPYCSAPLHEMGKYWICDTCRIVDVDASGYKTMRESVTSKEGEIAVFLKCTCDALEKYNNRIFRERTASGTLSAFDKRLLDFSSKFNISKNVLENDTQLCSRVVQQELYQILTLMKSDIAKELLKENHHV